MLIQSSNDVVYVVGEEPPAIEDGRQHGCDGAGCHCLVVGVFVRLRGEKTLVQVLVTIKQTLTTAVSLIVGGQTVIQQHFRRSKEPR